MIVHVRFIFEVLLCGLYNAAVFEQGLIETGASSAWLSSQRKVVIFWLSLVIFGAVKIFPKTRSFGIVIA
jgi:hypothetical protein